jgi:ribosome-binding protein aMBF1 (putative translation factor)
MIQRRGWRELREERQGRPGVRSGYKEAKLAYELGRQVRTLREHGGLSQRELATRMGTTQSVIARLEAGGSKPSLSTLERLAQAMGTTVEVRFRKQVGALSS